MLHLYLTLQHLWMVAYQAPLSMGFSRQKYWSGLPFPPPGDLPDPGIKPTSLMSPALVAEFFTTSTTWEAQHCSQEEKNLFSVGHMSKVHEKIPVSDNCTTCHMSSSYSLTWWNCHQGRSELYRKTYDSHSWWDILSSHPNYWASNPTCSHFSHAWYREVPVGNSLCGET